MANNIIIYKVCDATRLNRLALPAFQTITSLLEQASIAFEKPINSVYTEAEGCRIMTDLALAAFRNSLLMLLGPEESWTPNLLHAISNTSDKNSGSVTQNTIFSAEPQADSIQLEDFHDIITLVPETTLLQSSDTVIGSQETVAVEFIDNSGGSIQEITCPVEPNADSATLPMESISALPLDQEPVASSTVMSTELVHSADIQAQGTCPVETNADSTSVPTEPLRGLPVDQESAATSAVMSTELVHSVEEQEHSSEKVEISVNKPVSDSVDDVENQSPNTVPKRVHDGGIILNKSSKKHASTEMKFRSFEINWDKVSDCLLVRLRALQDFKNTNPGVFAPADLRFKKTEVSRLVNSVVDQLRMIDTMIRAETMGNVARQIVNKFPCLDFADDDGFGAGQAVVELKYKMINRNNYLNRFRAATKKPGMSLKKRRNARAGTIKDYWEKASKECDKDTLSQLKRDEINLLTEQFLAQSQAYVRYRLDEKVNASRLISQLPIIRRRTLLNFHFERATGKNIEDFRKYFASKRDKIIQYSLTCRQDLHLSKSSSDLEILRFLCSLVGENFDELLIRKEIGTGIDNITIGNPGPVLVAVDIGDNKNVYYVYADETRHSEGTYDVITAMEDLFAVQFVHNFMYPKGVSKFLELLQEYMFKIITLVGSKSSARRVGQRQRIVRKVITALSNFDCKPTLMVK